MKRLQQVSVLSTICQGESSNLAEQGEFRDWKFSFATFCSKLVFQYITVFKVHVNPGKWKALQDAFKRSIYAVGNHRISTLLEQRSSVWEMYFAELESLLLLNWQFFWLTIHMIKLWYLYRQNHTRGHNRIANWSLLKSMQTKLQDENNTIVGCGNCGPTSTYWWNAAIIFTSQHYWKLMIMPI